MMNEAQTQIRLNLSLIFQQQPFNSPSTGLDHSQSQRQSNCLAETMPNNTQSMHLTSKDIFSHNTNPSPPFSKKKASLNISAQQQIENISKLIAQKEQVIPIKKIQNKGHLQIVQRLFKPKGATIKQVKQMSKSLLVEEKQQSIKKLRKTSLSNQRYSSGGIFERLHRQSEMRKIRSRMKQAQKQQKEGLIEISKSLIVFKKEQEEGCSKRLEEYLNKSQEKDKFYINNPQLADGRVDKYFKPKLIPSKYSRKVLSRYNKGQMAQLKAQEIAEFMNSQESSFLSIDKSLQLVNQMQGHFFRKMEFIFLSEEKEDVVVSEQTVSLLSEVQFRILQPFILWIEQSKIKKQQFEHYLRDFYNILQGADKQELRSHEIKIRNKFSKLRREKMKGQILSKKSSKINLQLIKQEVKPVSSLIFTVRSQVSLKYKGDHMDKILYI